MIIPESPARINGLNLIRPEDADYVQALSTWTTYNRHPSEVRGTAEEEDQCIEGYEADLRKLYHVIERKEGTRCGLVRLYVIEDESFTRSR